MQSATDRQEQVLAVLHEARSEGRTTLSPLECSAVLRAYGVPLPREGVAQSAAAAADLAEDIGFPVVMKIVSEDILHKTEAGGVLVGVADREQAERAYRTLLSSARAYKADAALAGVQVQEQVSRKGVEVIVGAVTDPSFGKVVAFGLGGVLVEVLRDVTFRLAPATRDDALSMLDGVAAAEVLKGVRGGPPVQREALADIIVSVSQLVSDFPEIREVDLNPVLADAGGATAVDSVMTVDFAAQPQPYRPSRDEIVSAMQRIMNPRAVAVIGASDGEGKIGNSVMKNIINGGYAGELYPINPRADEILGKKCFKSVKDIPGEVDVAIFAVPAKFCAAAMTEVGEKGIPGAVMIPSGFAEVGEKEMQAELLAEARKYNVRVMGPNIYGFYYTPANLCATFCTPYDVKGPVALSSQSGGVGMSIIGFSRSTRLGVSAIVGLGNKSDLDEDDLLTYFEQDDNTQVVAMHAEDLKDGRSFYEVASRVSKKKPVVMLKAGRTQLGARAAASHTGALAGDDKVYDDLLKACGVVRAYSLNDMLQFARGLSVLPTPKGEEIVIITGAGGSGVLLSDAVVANGLSLMKFPQDLDEGFKQFIPPFGASGNPVDITGGEPPTTYERTIRFGLEDDRIHALILGYWHTIITPPMVFAELCARVVQEGRDKGIEKPVVVSLVGDVQVEEASEYLYERGIVACPYTTELPVAILGAKYRWARGAGLLG
ncbi:MAG: acetate--CoA ligase family protein [Deltaproteobacteria bacterium]|nr:acetate--CoA ligase family protein [Deltaproteobacteria bacterium]